MSLIRSVRLEATVATRRNPAHQVSYDQALVLLKRIPYVCTYACHCSGTSIPLHMKPTMHALSQLRKEVYSTTHEMRPLPLWLRVIVCI